MVLQDLFDTLATGEFTQLSLGNSVTGSIKEEAYPKVVRAINRGLRELYKRFLLQTKDCWLHQQADVTVYYLRPQHVGVPESMGPDVYIEDSDAEPLDADIVRILSAKDAAGDDIPINSTKVTTMGFYTKAFDTIKLTPSSPLQTLEISYQSGYPEIVITEDFDPEAYNLYYPSFIEEALTNYIASLLVKGKVTKASEGEGYATNTFTYKYEQACQKIIELGLAEEAITIDSRFERKGFV